VRFESLSLRIPGDQLSVHFHERLTVLSGLGAVERQGFVEALLGALSGNHANSTELVYTDALGRRVTVVHENGRLHFVDDAGLPVSSPLEAMRVDHPGLRGLCLLGPGDLGLALAEVDVRAVPQLAEARSALQRLSEELDAAFAAHQRAEALSEAIVQLDERLRRAEDAWAEVRYAALLADLDQVRAEAAALRRASGNSDAHRQFTTVVREAIEVAERWAAADAERSRLREQFGDRRRLDPETLAKTPPTTEDAAMVLDELAQALHAAERRRDDLQAVVQERTVSTLGEPAHPAVVQLAKQDQDTLWAAAQKAIHAEHELERQSLALGGVRPDGVQSSLADEIEEAHEAVFQAERVMEERRRAGFLSSGGAGLMAAALSPVAPIAAGVSVGIGLFCALWMLIVPRRALKKVTAEEGKVLEKAGVPTYLAFHLRRVEATVDPRARQRLNDSTMALQTSLAAWHAMAGPITPVQALALKDEVTTYARALHSGAGLSETKLEELRRELIEEAEPAVQDAMAAMMAACHRLGVDDPETAIDVARKQDEIGVIARLQRDLEAAEDREAELRVQLDGMLREVGFEGDDLSARISSLQRLLLTAGDQEPPWTSTRSLAEVETELAELEARARRERPATWGTRSAVAGPVDEQELEELRGRRAELHEAWAESQRNLPDIADLADRRSALERRVTRLEASAAESATSVQVAPTDVVRHLTRRLDEMAGRGLRDDLLPLILDEPFARLRGDDKWAILDVVEALCDRAQVIYVTDDADVVAWARRRASGGTLRLLEPNGAAA
jgi:hypothetical protein